MTDAEAGLKRALGGDRFALVGAGQLGDMALDLWPAALPRPEFALDSARTGTLRGIEIRDLAAHDPVPGVTYLVSAFKIPRDTLARMLERTGQREILTVYDLFEAHIPDIFTNGWRNLAAAPDVLARIGRLPDCYADHLSGRICAAVSAWRYERRLAEDYPITAEADKYNLAQRGRAGTHYRCVYDCGSYDLSLPDTLGKAGVTFDELVAFEPDPTRFAVCAERPPTVRSATGAAIDLRREAVSDRPGRARFLANGLFSARLVRDDVSRPAVTQVDTCTLDGVHADRFGAGADRVLIKLHVEGAEFPALAGAARLLRETRCDILVNLSHDEVSYREIPPLLAALDRFDLSLHLSALFGEGLTLFARNRD